MEVIFMVLASCMHAGVRVLRVARDGDEKWSIKVLAKFEEHESMNYASDVGPRLNAAGGEENNAITCVSTSFYDRKLCIWRYEGIGEPQHWSGERVGPYRLAVLFAIGPSACVPRSQSSKRLQRIGS
jgi:hypothetical protein